MACDPFTLLTSGNIFGSFLCPFQNLIGQDILITFLLVILFGITYIKTESFELIALQMIIGGAAVFPYAAPQMQIYWAAIIITGVVLGVYNFYRSYR